MKTLASNGNFKIPQTADLNVKNIGEILSKLLQYVLPIAGILMLFMIIAGGYSLIFSFGDPERIKEGTKRVVFGIVGFLLVFAGWWTIKLIEIIFGIKISSY